MSASTQAVDLVALAAPELNRRPRRRRGFVLLGFALVCFAVAGVFTALLFSDEVQNAREGLLALSIMFLGGTALLIGIALIAPIVVSLRPRILREAAWLEDPFNRAFVRWWDGRSWTEHTHPRDPAVVALPPLTSSRRRHKRGLVLLVGGAVVAVAAEWLSRVFYEPPTYGFDPSTGSTVQGGSSSLWIVVAQVTPVAALVAVVGLYLLLTLDDDPRAGWTPDPLDPSRMRWWDGRSWTDLSEDAPAA